MWGGMGAGEGNAGREGGLRRTMAAMLQMSVLAPHLAPRMTSGERYCRVWMSFVKWWLTQQALPRSAILTEIFSNAGSFGVDVPVDEFLSNEMPDISLDRMSL